MNDEQPQANGTGDMGGDQPQTPQQPPMPHEGGDAPEGGDNGAPAPQDPGLGGTPTPGGDAPAGEGEEKKEW